jgi:hypothetical protein
MLIFANCGISLGSIVTKQIKSAIRALTAETPRSKTGLLRTLLPEIEDALAAGHKLKAVWGRLTANGVQITYTQFCLYLKRVRNAKAQTAPGHRRKSSSQVKRVDAEEFDPLHNVRLRETARPGFHYRGTQDLSVLVYGRKQDHGNQRHRE